MSKNMTRKGLAFGAAFALIGAGFTAAPAFASTVSTSVHLGPNTNTLVGSANEINLATQLSADTIGGTDANLKYRILNPSGATIGIGVGNDGTTSATGTISAADATDTLWNTATGTLITSATTDVTDFVVIPANATTPEEGEGAAVNMLQVWTTASETTSITVQAFLDTSSPATNTLDEVEDKGPLVPVTFYKSSAITWNTAISKPAATDTTLSAAVTTSPMINGEYLNGNVTVNFTRQDSSATIESSAATWSSITNRWTASVSLGEAIDWAGMPNRFDLKDVSLANGDATTTTETDVASGIAVGDVVTVAAVDAEADAADVAVDLVSANTFTYEADTAGTGTGTNQADAGYVVVKKKNLKTVEATKTVATFETEGAHGLRVGDFVSVNADSATFDFATRTAVASVPTTTTFTLAFTTALDAVVANAADDGLVTYESFDKAFAGNYSAQAKWNSAVRGAVSESGAINVEAASTNVSTTASATVQGVDKAGAAGTILVKAGTTSVPVSLTVLDADGDHIGAGHPVSVGTLTPTGPVTVNARSTSGEVLYTDANGQVTLTVASPTGTAGHSVVVEVTPENVTAANAGFTMTWASSAVGLVDLNTTGGQLTDGNTYNRKVLEDGSYELNFLAADQWFTAADSTEYRILVSGDGATGGAYALTDGRAAVTVSDLDIGSTWNTSVKLQRLVSGTWTDSATYTFANDDITSAAIKLGADGSNSYGNAADLSDAVAKEALVEIDQRLESTATPVYVNDLVLNGQVTNESTGVTLEGALVTLSGPNSILFSNDKVASRGSITVLSDASGRFEVKLYSTTGQEDTEITVSALGVSETVDVTFTGRGAGEATVLSIDAPNFVSPASSLQIKAMLTDEFETGIADTVKVTYTGPGIVFGDLPTATDADGELSFTALLGANDSGSITVTVSYDQNADGDYTDAKDLVTTKTITIGDAPATQKVNAGSFKGFVAVYARGYEGQRLSAKIGNDWVIVDPIVNNESDDLHRTTDFTGAGVDIAVRIYIDRVLIDTINLTTK